jgi:mannose-6-phosphate isomerase-like protein (cupin superfamily)
VSAPRRPTRRVVVSGGPTAATAAVSAQPLRGFDPDPGVPCTVEWVWATDGPACVPHEGDPVPTVTAFLPPSGGTRFVMLTFAPGYGVDAADTLAGRAERLARSGIVSDGNGLVRRGAYHATDSIDYGVVVDGTVTLELDTGEAVVLERGDCFVQVGAGHAWRNTSDADCRVAVVLIGADRSPPRDIAK